MKKNLLVTLLFTSLSCFITAQKLFKDLLAGSNSSSPTKLTSFNGNFYFFAENGLGTGYVLWGSNGTSSGTSIVKNTDPSSSPLVCEGTIYTNNQLMFYIAKVSTTEKTVWRSDGSAGGTFALTSQTEIGPPENLTMSNGILFFTLKELGWGRELWKTDGTIAGTIKLKEISAGSGSAFTDNPTEIKKFADVNGLLYFAAKDGNTQWRMFRSDGTTAGTYSVAILQQEAYNLTPVGNDLFFVSNEGGIGAELYKMDVSTNQISLVKDIFSDNNINGIMGSSPENLFEFNGKLFFTAISLNEGRECWVSDGTENGTFLVKDINPGDNGINYSNLITMVKGGNYMWFTADGLEGNEIWKSDGTETGTTLVKDVYPGFLGSAPEKLYYSNGLLYFSAYPASSAITPLQKMFFSNGTAEGTRMVNDVFDGIEYYSPSDYLEYNGMIYFNATDEVNGSELWAFDLETVGLNKSQTINNKELKIGPNPVLTNLQIFSKSANGHNTKYSVRDVMGKEVMKGTLEIARSLDCSLLTPGLYFIEITIDSRQSKLKFVKE